MFHTILSRSIALGRHKELYPTVAFANRRSKVRPFPLFEALEVRIELVRALMALPAQFRRCLQVLGLRQAKPSPRDPRLLRSDFSACLALSDDANQGGGSVSWTSVEYEALRTYRPLPDVYIIYIYLFI